MNAYLMVARAALAAVFAFAALTKLRAPARFAQSLAGFGVPAAWTGPAATLLLTVEALVAGLLLFDGPARAGAAAALVLLGLFTVTIVTALARGRRPECHCFGQAATAPVGAATIARNVAFGALAVFVLWDGRPAPFTLLQAAAGTLGAIVVLQSAVILRLLRRHGQLLLKLESLTPAVEAGQEATLGARVPAFDFPSPGGGRLSLAELLDRGRPLLLVFLSPQCGPCAALLPRIADWQSLHAAQLTVAVVCRSAELELQRHLDVSALRDIVLEQPGALQEMFGASATPSAVLIDTGGRVAGRIEVGGDSIAALVERAAAAWADTPGGILEHQPA